MAVNPILLSLFTEQAVQKNRVTNITISKSTITIQLEAEVASHYERPDCQRPVAVHLHDSETILVQGLGVQGRAVRYSVKMQRVAYVNDAGTFVTFTAPLPGLRTDLLVTEEVVERAMYFLVDRNQSLPTTVEILRELYQVETSKSALERWKTAEAEKLPSVGEIVQGLNEKKITTLHLDEYKAKGTRSWELIVRDEHGRLLFSFRLKARSGRQIQAVLRWLRLWGVRDITTCYVDFFAAYPSAIRAVYPQAQIQYDFFHVVQNIHRHLYKALTAYRKAFKSTVTEPEQKEIRAALHKKLWDNRYLLFTNDENLSSEQRQVLDELLLEHADTLVEQIVLFRQCLRGLLHESETFQQATERFATLILEGWRDVSETFSKVMTFLEDHLDNILTYLRVPEAKVQRYSLSECTVRSLRRIETIRQGFKTQHGRVNHLKLLVWRRYLRPVNP